MPYEEIHCTDIDMYIRRPRSHCLPGWRAPECKLQTEHRRLLFFKSTSQAACADIDSLPRHDPNPTPEDLDNVPVRRRLGLPRHVSLCPRSNEYPSSSAATTAQSAARRGGDGEEGGERAVRAHG